MASHYHRHILVKPISTTQLFSCQEFPCGVYKNLINTIDGIINILNVYIHEVDWEIKNIYLGGMESALKNITKLVNNQISSTGRKLINDVSISLFNIENEIDVDKNINHMKGNVIKLKNWIELCRKEISCNH